MRDTSVNPRPETEGDILLFGRLTEQVRSVQRRQGGCKVQLRAVRQADEFRAERIQPVALRSWLLRQRDKDAQVRHPLLHARCCKVDSARPCLRATVQPGHPESVHAGRDSVNYTDVSGRWFWDDWDWSEAPVVGKFVQAGEDLLDGNGEVGEGLTALGAYAEVAPVF